MPPKRKGNQYLEQIEEVKRKKHEDIVVPDEKVDFEFVAATAEELLRKILSKATPSDVLAEYLFFLKNVPSLLNNQLSDLLHVVKSELGIDQIVGKIETKQNFKGDRFPILDALSFKLGTNLRHPLPLLLPPASSAQKRLLPTISQHKYLFTHLVAHKWLQSMPGSARTVPVFICLVDDCLSLGVSNLYQLDFPNFKLCSIMSFLSF